MGKDDPKLNSLAKFTSHAGRYHNHQQGVAGSIIIRLVEARGLDTGLTSSAWWPPSCNAYFCFSIGKHEIRSSTATSNANPTWRREFLSLSLEKLNLVHAIRDIPILVELRIEAFTEGSIAQKAGIRSSHRLGSGILDITDLVDGKAEVLDQWVCLREDYSTTANIGKKKSKINGEVHIMLQYEPRGFEPVVGDIVMFEGFGSFPSCIFPTIANLSLIVKKVNGNYLLCGDLKDQEVSFRLHRNCVFVVERRTYVDLILQKVMVPISYAMNTKIGFSICEKAEPYVLIAMTLSAPAISAAKTTLIACFRASAAALGSFLKP